MDFEKVNVAVKVRVDYIHCDVFGHELPILAHLYTPDALHYVGRGDLMEIEDPAGEFERLRQAYGVDPHSKRSVVETVLQGGPMGFQSWLDSGQAAIDQLERTYVKKFGGPLGGRQVAPVKEAGGEPESTLTKAQIADLYHRVTGEKVSTHSIRKESLFARLLLAVDNAYLELEKRPPPMTTHEEMAAAVAALLALRDGEEGGEE